jgi:hypothetical protein
MTQHPMKPTLTLLTALLNLPTITLGLGGTGRGSGRRFV